MKLKDYRSKRNFNKTPEPGPASESRSFEANAARNRGDNAGPDREKRLIYVIQKHAARALHYDLRLEMEGVLKSWAIPKGPSLNPSIKRLAVMVEDHPFDYKDFEGMIPKGNYGAGSVIIWDRGSYRHPSDEDGKKSEKLLLEGLRKGDIKFVLDGEKLRGEFALVRTKKEEKSWLLLKKKDRFATTENIPEENRSVVSHKTLDDIVETDPKKPSRQKETDQDYLRKVMEGKDLKNAPIGPMPRNIRPMLATLIEKPFDDPDWIYEIKWDGYRAVAVIRDGTVTLYSRNLISLNEKFSSIVDSLKQSGFEAVFDGEIVVTDNQGHADFQMLQDYNKTGSGYLVYYVFDLLYLAGHDLTGLPLLKRKDILKKVLPSSPKIRFSDHVWKEGALFFNAIKEKGLEGIIAKHAQSLYVAGKRSRQWLKVKTHLTQDAVIAGFTEPSGRRRHFGALVLGVFDGDELIFIGHTGGGFNAKMLGNISEKLSPLVRKKCPFKIEPKTNTPVTWVEPELVCEVIFHGWTDEGLMRQPVFSRMREDKAAREIVREKPS